MATVPLSHETIRRLELLFHGEDAVVAADLLTNECGSNLPGFENCNPLELERFRFAALKFSDGNLDRLLQAIELAQQDWRDRLMAAGFGRDARAHVGWMPQKLDGSGLSTE
jgi:hypothetical protein